MTWPSTNFKSFYLQTYSMICIRVCVAMVSFCLNLSSHEVERDVQAHYD